MHENNLYLFGGFSRDIFNDIRVLDMNTLKWRLIHSTSQHSKATYTAQQYVPSERFSHSMVKYQDKLVVFGGAGQYIPSIKMRVGFNDIQIFDLSNELWMKEPDLDGAPKKRMNQAASLLGCMMLIHGGLNTESKRLMEDMKVFDIELMKWVDTRIYNKNEQRVDNKSNDFYSSSLHSSMNEFKKKKGDESL